MAIILAGIVIAFGLFYYLHQKRKTRNNRREKHSRDKFKQLLNNLKQSKKE